MERLNIPTYEARVMGLDDSGIYALSFVDYPAIERNFVALKKGANKVHLHRAKQVLTGPVLIPDMLIYRNDEMGEYYLKFTRRDIERIADKMMKKGIALSSTTHQHVDELKGNYLTETWIVIDSKTDKSVALGLGEMPVGTLMASYKIVDSKYWVEQVVSGKVRGFSIEGFFNFNNVNMTKVKQQPKKVAAKSARGNAGLAFLKGLMTMLEGDTAADADDLADEAKKDETNSGEPMLAFELADGGEVLVDSEGYATLDGETMPAGEHQLTDGNFIVIDDSGALVVTQEDSEGGEAVEANAALEAAREAGKAFFGATPKAPAKKTAPAKKVEAKRTVKDIQIAALKAKLAKLEGTESAGKAKPGATVEGDGKVDLSAMSHTDKIAYVIKARQARAKENRKAPAPTSPATK